MSALIICGQRTTFWPDHECIEAECCQPPGHPGDHVDGFLDWPRDDADDCQPEDPCAGGRCTDPAAHAEGGHDV